MLLAMCVLTEALADIQRGIYTDVLYETQTVDFTCALTRPHTRVKWFKSGIECLDTSKYVLTQDDNGLLHHLTVNDVQHEDEGIYTFKVIDEKVETSVVIEGQWPGEIPKEIQTGDK